MLAIDLDPLNPISSFLKTLNLEDSRSISVLSVIADTNLDLTDLGLEEVFMHQPENQPTIKKMMSPPPPPLPPPLPIFLPPPFVPNNQTCLTYSSNTDLKHLFTIDDVAPSKWHKKFVDVYSWCSAELQTPNSTVT